MSDTHTHNKVIQGECECVLCGCFEIVAQPKSCPQVSDIWGLCVFLHLHIFLFLSVVDIDECSALAQPCSLGFNCINTVGSFVCQRRLICSRGYHASPDGARCIGMIVAVTNKQCDVWMHQFQKSGVMIIYVSTHSLFSVTVSLCLSPCVYFPLCLSFFMSV